MICLLFFLILLIFILDFRIFSASFYLLFFTFVAFFRHFADIIMNQNESFRTLHVVGIWSGRPRIRMVSLSLEDANITLWLAKCVEKVHFRFVGCDKASTTITRKCGRVLQFKGAKGATHRTSEQTKYTKQRQYNECCVCFTVCSLLSPVVICYGGLDELLSLQMCTNNATAFVIYV